MTGSQSAGSKRARESDNMDEKVSISAIPAVSNAGQSEAALTPGGFMSSGPSTNESTATISNPSSGETSSSELLTRAFSLLRDISCLPAGEQTTLWSQVQQTTAMLQAGVPTSPSTITNTSPCLPPGPLAAAQNWEIAPGRIIEDDKYQMLSASFLSRDSVSRKIAQQISMTQWVLNKTIRALDQLKVIKEEDCDCQCSVIRGVLRVKIGDLRTTIGQGGMIILDKECLIQNVSHKEAIVQVWWRKEDD